MRVAIIGNRAKMSSHRVGDILSGFESLGITEIALWEGKHVADMHVRCKYAQIKIIDLMK